MCLLQHKLDHSKIFPRILIQMQLFDITTMPLDQAVKWDPLTVLGQALTTEPWKNQSDSEKQHWLSEMNSGRNDDTFVSKLLDFECFILYFIRGPEVFAKFVFLENFQRFVQGPIFEGPYAYPDINQ